MCFLTALVRTGTHKEGNLFSFFLVHSLPRKVKMITLHSLQNVPYLKGAHCSKYVTFLCLKASSIKWS